MQELLENGHLLGTAAVVNLAEHEALLQCEDDPGCRGSRKTPEYAILEAFSIVTLLKHLLTGGSARSSTPQEKRSQQLWAGQQALTAPALIRRGSPGKKCSRVTGASCASRMTVCSLRSSRFHTVTTPAPPPAAMSGMPAPAAEPQSSDIKADCAMESTLKACMCIIRPTWQLLDARIASVACHPWPIRACEP